MDRISIIVPCLNEAEALPIYYREMTAVMKTMQEISFELIFVDDGSGDETLAIMKRLNQVDGRCRYLSFSRNFGKEAAIYAGLQAATGDYVAVMDVDLQDPPSLLPRMYRLLQRGDCDCVAARRADRTGEAGFRSFLSDRFYGFANRICGTKLARGARDFRLMRRSMVDAVLELGECSRFSKGIFEWVGFRTEWIEYENVERSAGETKWPLHKLFAYAAEGITGFSTAPLMLALAFGAVFSVLSLILLLAGGVESLSGHHVPVLLLIGGLVFFVSGVQLLCSGISAWYLSRTYLEVKHRPVYILREQSGACRMQEAYAAQKEDIEQEGYSRQGKNKQLEGFIRQDKYTKEEDTTQVDYGRQDKYTKEEEYAKQERHRRQKNYGKREGLAV